MPPQAKLQKSEKVLDVTHSLWLPHTASNFPGGGASPQFSRGVTLNIEHWTLNIEHWTLNIEKKINHCLSKLVASCTRLCFKNAMNVLICYYEYYFIPQWMWYIIILNPDMPKSYCILFNDRADFIRSWIRFSSFSIFPQNISKLWFTDSSKLFMLHFENFPVMW